MVLSRAFIKLRIFLEMIKVEHTLFALPFAYTGAILVENKVPTASNLLWITLAMVGARTAAMSLNRIIDLHIDAKNPRTANRALPRGLLSVAEVWVYVAVSLLLLFTSAYQLSPLAFKLSPAAVVLLVIYPYTKRFTWACHFVLGLTLGMAPLGAWIAISNSIATVPLILAAGVMFWVAGFDIIYACDDYEFDISEGVYSIPAKFGIKTALTASSLFHAVALIFFILTGRLANLGWAFYLGIAIAGGLIMLQHKIVKPEDLSKSGLAFFNLNAWLSVVIFLFSFCDVVLF